MYVRLFVVLLERCCYGWMICAVDLVALSEEGGEVWRLRRGRVVGWSCDVGFDGVGVGVGVGVGAGRRRWDLEGEC